MIIPNDSFVDYNDIFSVDDPFNIIIPSNRNPARANASLQCITDLVDCCGTESGSPVRAQHGNWYFPNGTAIGFGSGRTTRFVVNREGNNSISHPQLVGQCIA